MEASQHLMRAIRSRGWVAKELIRELTIAELGCKGKLGVQTLKWTLGFVYFASLKYIGDTETLLSAMPMLKYCDTVA